MQPADFLLALLLGEAAADERRRLAVAEREPRRRRELDVQGERIDDGHLPRHPAGQVDERALAGDDGPVGRVTTVVTPLARVTGISSESGLMAMLARRSGWKSPPSRKSCVSRAESDFGQAEHRAGVDHAGVEVQPFGRR